MSDPPHGAPQASAFPFPPALLEGWRDAFVNRERPYALQQADGSYRWVYEECTLELLAAHLAGDVTLALSSTTERGWTRWACLDVDVPGSLPQLLALRDALDELTESKGPPALPGLVMGSRRGGHLWLLLEEPVPARALRYVIRQALDVVATQGVEVPAHELYPDRDGARTLGHAVRLPLGVHRRTGSGIRPTTPRASPASSRITPARPPTCSTPRRGFPLRRSSRPGRCSLLRVGGMGDGSGSVPPRRLV